MNKFDAAREEYDAIGRDEDDNVPTAEQLAALEAYAAEHGRTWKSQLNDDWMNGRASGPLQQVRNQFGPTWLTRFRLPKESHGEN